MTKRNGEGRRNSKLKERGLGGGTRGLREKESYWEDFCYAYLLL